MSDYRPVEEPFGPDEPDFTDTEADAESDDTLQDEQTDTWEEQNTDDPTVDEVSDEEAADLAEGEAPSNRER